MKKQLSHKDLVKWGMHEISQGYTLNKIEADFLEKGVERKDAMKALKVIDYYKKREELKARKESESKKQEADRAADTKQHAEHKQQTEKKPSFWIYFFVFLVLVGLALFYYFYKQ